MLKKILVLVLAISTMFVATSCGNADSSAAQKSSSDVPKNKLDKILEKGQIVMATSPDFAPNEFIDLSKTGQDSYVGSDIELGKYIADKLGVELVIEAMDFSACQAAVTTGTVDMAIAAFGWKEDRAESMGLSDFYNIEDSDGKGQGILVLKENIDKYKTAEDFSGKVIAAQNGSLQYDFVVNQLPADTKLEPISNLNDAVMMLLTKKVDVVAVASTNGEAYAANYEEVAMGDFFFDYTSQGNVICMTKGEDELLEKVNEIIAEVNEEGLYPTWKEEAISLANELGVDM